jgi:hypothetical protein
VRHTEPFGGAARSIAHGRTPCGPEFGPNSGVRTQIRVQKLVGARDLNPGPHGPELCVVSSTETGFECLRWIRGIERTNGTVSSSFVALDYYMNYYMRKAPALHRPGLSGPMRMLNAKGTPGWRPSCISTVTTNFAVHRSARCLQERHLVRSDTRSRGRRFDSNVEA